MLSSTAYSLRQKARLAISLAWVGGFVDVVGFKLLGAFTSNMTGNTAALGAQLSAAEGSAALFVGLLVLSFLVGAVLSGVLTVGGRRWGVRSIYSVALAVEAALLVGFLVWIRAGVDGTPLLLAALPCLAMGLQNATITQIGGSVVRTTHVTGVVTDLGLESVQFVFWFHDRTRGRLRRRLVKAFRLSPRHPSMQRLLLLLSIWGSFLVGAALGLWMYSFDGVGPLALLGPICFLLFMVLLDLVRPIASVSKVDHLQDRELTRFGVDPGVLPPTVGVYRVQGTGRGKVRPPDLGTLDEQAGRRWKVIVLILSPEIRLDPNSLLGLSQSLTNLRIQNRRLVLCVGDAEQFEQVTRSPAGEALGPANVCSDVEFAVARAVALTSGTGEA